jgi:hypothetical protein
MSELLLDRAGRRRSPATMPGFHAGRPPWNPECGIPPIRAGRGNHRVMRAAGDGPHGRRLRGLIVYRAGGAAGVAKAAVSRAGR